MPPLPVPMFNPWIFVSELIFTVLAVFFCFLIYFKTKEIYELTKYEGIKYFRGAFLFFGLSYILRFILSLITFSSIAFDFFLPREMFALLFILPLGYFSTVGIFYLIFNSVWKKFNSKKVIIIGHLLAVLLSVVSFITRSSRMLLYLQCALLVIAVILGFVFHRHGKKLTQIRLLYFLIALLWLINLLVIDSRRPFPLGAEIFFQVVSLVVFITIYFRISKRIG